MREQLSSDESSASFDARLLEQHARFRAISQPLAFDLTQEQIKSAFGTDPKEERDDATQA